ncbi:MAG: 50S ribosome-binding GTPase, partial [Synergistaceae bacterium]|nr:50S ribosome-binding GTPase [Synergistaceae bacterium]
MGRTVWFPGHMVKGRRRLEELSGHLDLLLEVRDARAPRLTSSPALRGIPEKLSVWILLSKADLADSRITSDWTEYLGRSGRRVWAVDLNGGVPQTLRRAIDELRPSTSRNRVYRDVRIAVVGTPNVGKSTLLNRLVGRGLAPVGGVPGITKGVSWFNGEGYIVADTPGILDPHSDARAHRMLAWISSTKGQVIGSWANHACECIGFLQRRDLTSGAASALGVDMSGSPADILEAVGRRLGRLLRGGVVDLEASGKAFIGSLSVGRLGRLSLERP